MAERVHMTAPDGRTFTFEEWCAYLKEPGHDTEDPYRTETGEVFDIDGFVFNVHGCCLNPHKIHIAPEGDRLEGILTYCDIRTYRKWYDFNDHRVVWKYEVFDMNAGGGAFGRLHPDDPDDEEEAIFRCLLQCRKHQDRQIEWYKRALDGHLYDDCGYSASLRRVKKMQKMIDEELEKRMQLTLF